MKKFLTLLCVMGFVASARADWFGSSKKEEPAQVAHASSLGNTRHEILLNFSDYALNHITFSGGDVSIGMGAGYNYRLIPLLQLGARMGITHTELEIGRVKPDVTEFLFLAGGTLNFPTDWKFQDEFFGGLHLGILHRSVSGLSTTPFIFEFEVGKRFQVFQNLCYRPFFSMMIPTNGESVIGNFGLLAISAVF
jgi:hypothetical protein